MDADVGGRLTSVYRLQQPVLPSGVAADFSARIGLCALVPGLRKTADG
ncbi:MAG: hypothetical protein IRZ16_11340 [Myxococcaceae bacterium]|nr:hypothetical protein [Myxococcaceae bacterium]